MSRSARRLGALLTTGWLAASAQAAWVVEPSAELRTEYESNIRLEPDDSVDRDAVATTATLQASLRSVTERSEISALAGINYVTFGSYDGPSRLDDRDYQFARVAADRRLERGALGVLALYRRDDLFRRINVVGDPVAGELPPEAPAEPGEDVAPPPDPADDVPAPDDVDADTVGSQVRRSTLRVLPYFRWALGERTEARVGYVFSRIRVEEDVVGFADSDLNGVDLSLARDLTEIDRAELIARASRFDSDDVDADLYESTLSWTHRFGPRTRMNLRAGAYRADGNVVDDDGFLLNLRLDRRTLSGRMVVDLERSVLPSAFGDLLEADGVTLRYETAWSERWNMQSWLRAFSTESLLRQSQDRDYAEVGLELARAVTPAIWVGVAYRYRWIDRALDPKDVSGHVAGISLAYRPPSWLRR